MNIRTRIFICFLLVVSAGFYYLLDWIKDDLRPRYLETMEESLVDTANVLSVLFASNMEEGGFDTGSYRSIFEEVRARALTANIYDLVKTNVDVRVYITDQQGIVLFDSDGGKDEGKDYSRWNDVYLTLRGKYGVRSTRTDPDDEKTSILYVSAPLVIDGETRGVLTVCKPTVSSNLFMQSARRKITVAAFWAVGAVLLLAIITSVWVTRPIEKLTRYAKAIRDGRRVALPNLGRSEIGIMGQALEEMRDTLEGKEYVEHYVQTVAHELKGPLSAIRGAVELMNEDMPEDRREQFLHNVQVESERIRRIVDRLLLLTSLEKRKGLQDVEEFDLAELVREVIESLKPVLMGKRLSLKDHIEGPQVIHAEKELIHHAITNLLQNAAGFTPAGGQFEVTLTRRENRVALVIDDHGPGVPDYALEKVFDRFYSLPRPDTGRKSSGLGLAFVKEAAELHGGSARLENRPEGGTRATMLLAVDPRD